MSKRLPRCEHCYRPFRPDRYNIGRQKFCTRSPCVRERKRKRQREAYAKRRAEDPVFRADENTRCAAANRRRRAAERAGAESGTSPDDPVMLSHVVTGLLSHLADTTDPLELRSCLCHYEARGRRVASACCAGPDPP